MSSVGLLLVGAVLFVNGLAFLGYVESRGAAVINIFVGVLQSASPFFLLTHAVSADDVLNAAPVFLFGLTYLWTGINSLTGHDPTGMGWFCAWVAGMTVAFALVSFLRFDDPNQGIIWLNWGVLWAMFWLVLALGKDQLSRVAGWMTVIMSVWTCTIPAILAMVGVWKDAPPWTSLAATAATVIAVALLAGRVTRHGGGDRYERTPAPVHATG
ncbi:MULTISPECIES: AmiS/UreI family transporter [Mycolicibacterium]|uniref:AmiS/UreI family transporter n=1 Tax=Mycolicibacterium TaxID=1866885 RepID=UPI001CA32000|nr:AmiS/UreI family transporter [Mycolicibacterium austroafricanum]QZT55070.1 transporter [Mycolicibacterium austroafricanum]